MIQELGTETLMGALKLRDEIFYELEKYEYETLEASIYKDQFTTWYKKSGISWLKYWTYMYQNRVGGIVGLYTEADSQKNEAWLGWFGVDENARGLKIGSTLLDFSIKTAKELGYSRLLLYTTLDSEYDRARELYKKRGFEIFKKSDKGKTLYLELLL